jgi:hypothetical protein
MPTEPEYAESMLNLYEDARLEGSSIHDRQTLATHWLGKLEWFSQCLTRNSRTEADLQAIHAPVPTTLSDAIQTLIEIVKACQGHCELLRP